MDKRQWIWMMDYCKRKGIPPAENWAWEIARKSYKKNFKIDFQITKTLER